MNLFNNIYILKAFPFISSLFCFLLMILPIMPSGMGEITPMLGVIALSFWIIYLKNSLPFMSVFIIGLFHDIMIGTLLGVGSLAAIIIRLFIVRVASDKRTSLLKSFLIISLSLVIWTFIIALPTFIKSSFSLSYSPIIFQLLSSIVFSPIIMIILSFFLGKMKKYYYE